MIAERCFIADNNHTYDDPAMSIRARVVKQYGRGIKGVEICCSAVQGQEMILKQSLLGYLEGRVLRVITLEDKKTIHNAFPDRRFKKRN